MANPTTRDEFKEHCLRRLGKPVIDINVAEEQLDDKIDEALSFYADYHFDGTEHTYLKHVVTVIDKTNKYITVSDSVIGVTRILSLSDALSSSNMFSSNYQFALNNMHDIASSSMAHYVMSRQHVSLIQEILNGANPMRYNRHMNRVYIDMDWDLLAEGSYIVAEAYIVTDPEVYSDVWKDRMLQKYATALIKKQWGSNMMKYENVQLPGGIVLNGRQYYDDAVSELAELEEQFLNSYSLPSFDLMG